MKRRKEHREMGYLNDLTNYFRQSLIDADRLCPADNPLLPLLGTDKESDGCASYTVFGHEVWLTGRIPAGKAEAILNERGKQSAKPAAEVQLAMFPRVDLLRYRHGDVDSRKRRVLLPLVVFVRLDRGGRLKPADKAPWIPREWLAPNQGAAEPFADAMAVDAFLTEHPFEGVATWPALVAYGTRMLCWATGTDYVEATGEAPGTSLLDIEIHADYQLTEHSLLQLEDLPVAEAKKKLLKVFDALMEMREAPLLYQRFAQRQSPCPEANRNLESDLALAAGHVGQMTSEFPLSPKQRNALHHWLMQKDGEILAVNGPPGTGKTTLLRSVVATLWAQAALEEREPPLIVAASNNNQAVTNILESFAKVNEGGLDERLAGRWLPEVGSYGLYCCAGNKANDSNPYLYHGPQGEGAMKSWQTRPFFERARAVFLERTGRWMGGRVTVLEDAKKALYRSMIQCRKQIVRGLELLKIFQDISREIMERNGGIEALRAEITDKLGRLDALSSEREDLKSRLDQLYALWESRPLWIRLLSLVPGLGSRIRAQEYRRTARLLNRWDMILHDCSDAAVEGLFQERLKAERAAQEDLKRSLSELQALDGRYQAAFAKLDEWVGLHGREKLHVGEVEDRVTFLNDCVLRFELFKLATHYWEARWLIELDDFLTGNGEDKLSPSKILRKLRRFAKLTPCFVSTFYMTPSTFTGFEKQDELWKDIPLFGKIDLLIVDEAGQALPAVSAASFSLANRALVVGDTDQIEPVWSVPASVDRANLVRYNLLSEGAAGEADYDEFWLNSGLLASNGNLMRIAQRQCRFQQCSKLQRGLYLTEHRRCFDDIVGYCNALVYRGTLEPLRGGPEQDVPWGTLSLVPVETPSRSYGGSRGNPGEAKRIARWLIAQRGRIVEYAREREPALLKAHDAVVLEKAVGIITPFGKQAALIRSELQQSGIRGVTVGTVHSFQGDERLLVLFSSVYGINDQGMGKFYDKTPNMLNVAVSRARDSFIVFGSIDVFGMENRDSPSGMLRRRLSLLQGPTSEMRID